MIRCETFIEASRRIEEDRSAGPRVRPISKSETEPLAQRKTGLLVGISSGATLAAIAQKLPDLPAGATVLGFNYDTGERYFSVEGFLPA